MNTDPEIEAPREHPPDFVLELLAAGEGTARVTETWRNHAVECPRCTARLAALAEQGIEYRASPQARGLRDLLASAVHERAPNQGRRRRFVRPLLWFGLPATMAIGLIAILVVRAPESGGDLRIKGHGRFGAVVRHAGHTSSWDGAPLRPADEVQLTWAGPTPGFLVVLAREGGGDAVVLFPEHGDSAGAVSPGPDRAIGASLTIIPASRSFVATACFSKSLMRVEALIAAARRDAGGSGGCADETERLSFTVQTP